MILNSPTFVSLPLVSVPVNMLVALPAPHLEKISVRRLFTEASSDCSSKGHLLTWVSVPPDVTTFYYNCA